MSDYARILQVFQHQLAQRAAQYRFESKGSIATGRITFTREGQVWHFRAGADAERFLDGYECALNERCGGRAPRDYVGAP